MTTSPALQDMLKTALQVSQGAPTAPLSRVRDEGLTRGRRGLLQKQVL